MEERASSSSAPSSSACSSSACSSSAISSAAAQTQPTSWFSSSACSSSASSSSSVAAPPPAIFWFPPTEGEALWLTVHNIHYSGRAHVVDESKGLLLFKMSKPLRPRYNIGDMAALLSRDGRRWSGDILFIDEDEDPEWSSMCTILTIRVSPEGVVLGSVEKILVTVKPVAKLESPASLSSACSSSSAAAAHPPPTSWFPSSMKKKPMRLTVRDIHYTGQVNFVDELKSLLHFKLPKPLPKRRPRFLNGDLATLQSEGSRWSGEIVSVDDDENKEVPSLYTVLEICEATCWFPSSMTEQEMQLSVHNIDYTGRVDFVDELKSLLHFKLPKPSQPRFSKGDLATLQRKYGHRWSGEIIFIDDDEDKEGQSSLDTTLRIRVPPAGVTHSIHAEALKSLANIVVTVKPVAKLELSEEVVRVGISGFGMIERFLVEMGLQSQDVKIVAIHTPMSPEIMVKVWNSPNVSIAVKDSRTLIFTTRYYKGDPRKKKKNDVSVLLEHMEVTVLREPNQIPWEKANVDFVVDFSTFFNNDKDVQPNDQSQVQVIHKTEGLNNCLRCLPKVLDAFGLYGNGIIRAAFHKDKRETARRAARFNIVTCSSAAAKAVCHAEIFPDWNEEPASMSFLATAAPAALHGLANIEMSNVDLQVTLAKVENCSGIESFPTRFCDADEKVHLRFKAIMRWCLEIIRCMPIGACCLQLV